MEPSPASTPLAEQYLLGDVGEPDGNSPAAAVEPVQDAPAPASKTTQDRGPDGRFVKAADKPQAFTHSPRLTQTALDAGFSEEEIAATSSTDLRMALMDLRLAGVLSDRERAGERAIREERDRPAPQPQQQAAADDEFAALRQVTKENGYEDWAVKVANLTLRLADENKQLKQQVESVNGFVQDQVQRSALSSADRFFNQFPDLYGKGAKGDLDQKSAEFNRRALMYDAALRNFPNLPIGQALAKAHALMHPNAKPAAKPDAGPAPAANGHTNRITQEQWERDAGMAAPTGRHAPLLKDGDEKARRGVAAKLSEFGMDQSKPANTDDEFPWE